MKLRVGLLEFDTQPCRTEQCYLSGHKSKKMPLEFNSPLKLVGSTKLKKKIFRESGTVFEKIPLSLIAEH